MKKKKKSRKPQNPRVIEHVEPEGFHPTPVDAPAQWDQLRHQHYQQYFGESTSVLHEVSSQIFRIHIHIFPSSKKLKRNFTTLVTSGMSDSAMKIPKKLDPSYARREIIMYVPDYESKLYSLEQTWFEKILRYTAHFPFEYDTWLGEGHTIQNGNPPQPITEGSLLTNMFLLPPIYEAPEAAQIQLDDTPVKLLWLTFLTDAEAEYKIENGYSKLAKKFTHENFPRVVDPGRKSII